MGRCMLLVFNFLFLTRYLFFKALCSYIISNDILAFTKYDVVTKVNIINESPIQIPIITLCNLNGYTTEATQELINRIRKEIQIQNQSFESEEEETKYIRSSFLIKVTALDEVDKRALGKLIFFTFFFCQ